MKRESLGKIALAAAFSMGISGEMEAAKKGVVKGGGYSRSVESGIDVGGGYLSNPGKTTGSGYSKDMAREAHAGNNVGGGYSGPMFKSDTGIHIENTDTTKLVALEEGKAETETTVEESDSN